MPMTSTVGDGGLGFRGGFEGSISGSHLEINRRPYHKNCTCALHSNNRSSSSSSSCPHHKPSKVAYPIKRSWSEGSFSLLPAPASVNPSPPPPPSSSKGTPPLIPRASSSSNFDFFLSHQHL